MQCLGVKPEPSLKRKERAGEVWMWLKGEVEELEGGSRRLWNVRTTEDKVGQSLPREDGKVAQGRRPTRRE